MRYNYTRDQLVTGRRTCRVTRVTSDWRSRRGFRAWPSTGRVAQITHVYTHARSQCVVVVDRLLIYDVSWLIHFKMPIHWLKASERIAFRCAALVYKCLHVSAPSMNYIKWRKSRLISDSVLPRLHHRSSAALDYPPSGTEPFRSPLLVSGTVYPSTSPLHVWCLLSSHVSRLTFLLFPGPYTMYSVCTAVMGTN